MSIAVVTGGTRGIGAAIAARLATAGHEVVAVATSHPSTPPPENVRVEICDLTDEAAIVALMSGLDDIDILVNNAGVSSSNRLAKTSLEDWHRSLAVNATGPFVCSRAVIDSMIDRSYGRIVTVASIAALEGAKYIAAYAASKHAVIGLMRVIAAEVEGTGVTAGTVCPTFVRTEMTVATIRNIAERTGVSMEEAEAKLAEATPYGRIIDIDAVADAVMGLIDGDSNGREILLDGGPS